MSINLKFVQVFKFEPHMFFSLFQKINVRENRSGNQEWTIQRYMHPWAQHIERRQTKQKTQHIN